MSSLRPRLIVIGAGQKNTYPLQAEEFTIGRKNCSCPINAPSISEKHALIRFEGGGFTIEDQGSKNGTFLDRSRLLEGQAHKLVDGSYLQFADYEALFLVDEARRARDLTRKEIRGLASHLGGKVSRSRVRQAARDAKAEGRDLAEELLLNNKLGVSEYVGAIEAVRKAKDSAGHNIPLLIAVLVLSALVLILLVAVLIMVWARG